MKARLYHLHILNLFFFCFNHLNAQVTDTTETPSFFKGQITATQNGVSLIPNFSLNKPAVMFDLSLGKGRLSFDPMIRFGMNGKPWAFILWWRYKLVQQKRFNLGIGAHPSFVFRDEAVIDNQGVLRNYLATNRFFAWEVSPSYIINKHVNVGFYYLGATDVMPEVSTKTIFLAVRSGLNIGLSDQFRLGLIPQLYYLKMNENDGYYTNATLNLYKTKFPISFNAVVSQAINTKLPGKEFLWSVGLIYNINNLYTRKHI
jgi:hypothetical protein